MNAPSREVSCHDQNRYLIKAYYSRAEWSEGGEDPELGFLPL